jgi:hypothetical protein
MYYFLLLVFPTFIVSAVIGVLAVVDVPAVDVLFPLF